MFELLKLNQEDLQLKQISNYQEMRWKDNNISQLNIS